MISKIDNISSKYSQATSFHGKFSRFIKPNMPQTNDKFVSSSNVQKGILASFFALIPGLFAQKVNKGQEVNTVEDYDGYTNPIAINIPQENSIILQNNEEINMKQLFEEKAGDCWHGTPHLKNAIILDPNMSMKELKKFIPNMKYNEYSKKWEIPCPGYGGTKIDLKDKNVLTATQPTKANPKGSYCLWKMSDIFSDTVIPKQSVIDGNIRQVNFDKIDTIYNQPFEFYNYTPSKFVLLKAGTTVKDEGVVTTLKEDCVIIYPKIWQNDKNISIISVKDFIENYKPTVNESSNQKYEAIKDIVRQDFEIISPKGRKFGIVNGHKYNIDGIIFEKIKNLRDDGSMDGWYFDYEKMDGKELDDLYDKYYKTAKNKSARRITYNSDNGYTEIN